MTSNQNEIHKSRLLEIQDNASRGIRQIRSTVKFEIIRNKKSLLISIIAAVGVYLTFLIINLITFGRGVELPAEQIDYILSYFVMFELFVVTIGIMFAASIICEDFQKDTGNLIFPKTTKERLLTGRIIARYFLATVAITVYYILIGITTLIYYGSLTSLIFASWGWALLYLFLVFSVVMLFSSFMNSNSATIITSLLTLMMVFNLLNLLLIITGIAIEPLFLVSYYANIITKIFNMPTERFIESPLTGAPGPDVTGFHWITPSIAGAAIGMLVYAAILIIASYLIFRYRQKK